MCLGCGPKKRQSKQMTEWDCLGWMTECLALRGWEGQGSGWGRTARLATLETSGVEGGGGGGGAEERLPPRAAPHPPPHPV